MDVRSIYLAEISEQSPRILVSIYGGLWVSMWGSLNLVECSLCQYSDPLEEEMCVGNSR